MSSSSRAWKWTAQKEEAAALVARDDLTDVKIARRIRVEVRTLTRWKLEPEFAARVDALVKEFRARVRSEGIAVVENRLARENETWYGLRHITEERRTAALDQLRRHDAIVAEVAVLRAELKALEEAQERRRNDPASTYPDEIAEAKAAEEAREIRRIRDRIEELLRADPGMLEPGQDTGLLICEVTHTRAGRVMRWGVDTGLLGEMRAVEQQAAKELGQWTDNVRHSGSMGITSADLSKLPKEDLNTLEGILEKAAPDS